MGKGLITILLLLVSNILMILAWYGHLKFGQIKPFSQWGLFGIILSSWLIAFFEYCVQVPANRIGYNGNGGPFTLLQLKIIQEVLTLIVFVVFSALVFRNEPIKWNHFISFLCLVLAVYFAFK